MYYEYWGLKKPAFDNVPDPSMYVDCHTSMENAIAETLFAIEEGDECIAVIVGDVGLGKTMSLRMIIDSLAQEKYNIVLITNPGISFVQILQEIIGQLTGKQCEEKRKVDLLEMFNHHLFETLEEGRKILIFIDEANAITPINLENLRLLTNMQGDKRNLFTMVLAGQIEFAKRLEHPKRANLFQRVGTYSRIDKLESAERVRQYVETRVTLAGATKKIFADDAFEKLWQQSDHGVPRLVNKLSKLCLKAGETNNIAFITGEMVDQIGSRFHKLAGPAIQKRRSRKCTREEVPPEMPEMADKRDEPVASDMNTAEGGGSNSMDSAEEMCIGRDRITIDIPQHLMRQSLSSSPEHRFKLAGGLAAETLKKHPHLIASHSVDPVPIWLEIRNFVLDRMTHASSR
jgi:MSHA biogenesis protein MshM